MAFIGLAWLDWQKGESLIFFTKLCRFILDADLEQEFEVEKYHS